MSSHSYEQKAGISFPCCHTVDTLHTDNVTAAQGLVGSPKSPSSEEAG